MEEKERLPIDIKQLLASMIEMQAETIASNRLIIDALCELTFPDDKERQLLAKAIYRQKAAAARKDILLQLWGERGTIDFSSLFEGNGPKEEP